MADLTDVTFRTATDFGQFIEQGFGVPAYAVFSPALGMMPEIGGQWKGSSPGKHPLMPERYEEDDMFGILTECLPGRHHVTKQQNFDVETKHETTTFVRTPLTFHVARFLRVMTNNDRLVGASALYTKRSHAMVSSTNHQRFQMNKSPLC